MLATSSAKGFPAKDLIHGKNRAKNGWSPGRGSKADAHILVLPTAAIVVVEDQELVIRLAQTNAGTHPLLSSYTLMLCTDAEASGLAGLSPGIYDSLNQVDAKPARTLAERVIRDADTPEARIELAFRLATSRRCNTAKAVILKSELDERLLAFAADTASAKAYLTIGNRPVPTDIAHAELAAYSAVMSLILNLDESLSKS